MRYRLLGAVASLAVIAAFGALGASRAAPASRVAVATPMSIVLGGAHWSHPPTTAQCVVQTPGSRATGRRSSSRPTT